MQPLHSMGLSTAPARCQLEQQCAFVLVCGAGFECPAKLLTSQAPRTLAGGACRLCSPGHRGHQVALHGSGRALKRVRHRAGSVAVGCALALCPLLFLEVQAQAPRVWLEPAPDLGQGAQVELHRNLSILGTVCGQGGDDGRAAARHSLDLQPEIKACKAEDLIPTTP